MILFGNEHSAKKAYFRGTHRTRDPEQTLAEYVPFMPAMGITRLANVTGLDRIGLPVYVAVRPNSRALATSQGKGESPAAAKASALMESIEGWHGERIDAPLRFESYDRFRSVANAVDVAKLGIRADATLRADRPMLWIEGWDAIRGEPVWVPFDAVSTNFVQSPGEQPVFLKSSNGLASGNCLLEAVVHALCEVIERDAVTLWSLVPENRRKARQVDLATIADPAVTRLIDRVHAADTVLAAWDVTSDAGIPTYTCTIVEDPGSPTWRGIPSFSGHGTHLSPAVALIRAICEAIQSRLTVISGSRDDMFPRDYLDAGNRDDHVRLIASLRDEPATCPFAAQGPPVSGAFEDDLAVLLDALTDIGIGNAAVIDLTRPDIGIPVVKVVVPGLEAFRTALYAPGPRARRALAGARAA